MKKLLLKLKSILQSLFSTKTEKQEDTKPKKSNDVVNSKLVEHEVSKIVEKHISSVNTKKSSPDSFGKFDNGYAEPLSTGMIGTITSFLWKPESENSGNPVVLVSCDDVPTNELFIEVFNSKGNVMRSVEQGAFSRGNQLPNQKFARISFRLGVSMKSFKSAAPLTIKFFQVVEGQKTYLDIKNRKSKIQTVKDPHKRLEWS